ncbi:MAG: hypothetical protein J5554_00805, partial [Paludibacteraceae bacterium]|nr:hypothetical protein [Paludibacteraceae bacterium]
LQDVRTEPRFSRGYCMHEHVSEMDMIDMNGRLYDPVLCQFLSPDPYIQDPTNWQNYNRYGYCMQNPMLYTDPSGEFVWAAVIIGAVVGAYMGGTLANDGQMNPTKWNYSAGQTWGYMAGGAVVGAISGAAGGCVASSEVPFAGTMGLVFGSFINSVGTTLYTEGKHSNVSVSFGACSYDFLNNEFGYLGKSGNSAMENVGYGFGALANLSDVLMGTNPQKFGEVDLVTEHTGGDGHSAIVVKGTKTGGSKDFADPNGIISVGPDYEAPGAKSTWHFTKGKNSWQTYSNKSKGIWRETLKVNVDKVNNYASRINSSVENGTFYYSVEFSSCVTHTSAALNHSGVLNIGIHPYLLHGQMYLWGNGMRPWMFSHMSNLK